MEADNKIRTAPGLLKELGDKKSILANFAETYPVGITFVDRDNQIVFANAQAEKLLGIPRKDLTNLSFSDPRWQPADHSGSPCPESELPFQLVMRTGLNVRNIRHSLMRGDGKRVYLIIHATPLFSPEGDFQGMFALLEDATERKFTEDALRDSQEKYRWFVENFQGIVFRRLLDARLVFFSGSVEAISGYQEKNFSEGQTKWEQIIHPDDLAVFQETVAKAPRQDASTEQEYRIIHKDGEIHWVREILHVIRDREDQPVALQGVIYDITSHKVMEDDRQNLAAHFQHTLKLESLGLLAGGIAHDFNNLLMVILGNASMAMGDVAPNSPLFESLKEIETAARRASELSRQMLAYSGKETLHTDVVDINGTLQGMSQLFDASVPKNVLLKYHLTANLPAVQADESQLRQAILNLVANAADAVGDIEGTIHISTGVMECDQNFLAETYLDDRLPEGLYVFLEVADTGCGMDQETLPKIFDPFFTTKFTGRGLGLASSLGIIRGHQGAIRVESQPDVGTTVRVFLPASESRIQPSQKPENLSSWVGLGTILLVDDDEAVLRVAMRMLEKYNFRVITAGDGREAIEKYRQHQDEIVCVVLDLKMPVMDGEACLHELRQIRSDVPVLLSTGFSQHQISSRLGAVGFFSYIEKPYDPDRLIAKVRELIELD